MGVILHFAALRRSVGSERKIASAATGEVVIFTGVRYERWQQEAETKPKRRAKAVKRKKPVLQA